MISTAVLALFSVGGACPGEPGSNADSLYMTEDALLKATGTKDKELFKIDGATHIETYWVPKYVDTAMNKLTEFFGRSLGEAR